MKMLLFLIRYNILLVITTYMNCKMTEKLLLYNLENTVFGYGRNLRTNIGILLREGQCKVRQYI